MEDSVGLALQSCLGGRASDFHVVFLSNYHFRFSVFSKAVGFQVYKLKRVISSCFDVYFHLWNNGTPRWEREKRAWELEQEKEWSTILSKRAKREVKAAARSADKVTKKVHFAKKLVQSSLKNKFEPPSCISFGSFSTTLDPIEPKKLIFSNRCCTSPPHHRSEPSSVQPERENLGPTNQPQQLETIQNSDHEENSSLVLARDLAQQRCVRCLAWGHLRPACRSSIRCLQCFNYGHTKKWCLSRVKPNWVWLPKSTSHAFVTQARPKLI
jgi:hypothetical protein